MTQNSQSWIGRTIDGFRLGSLLADGAFSWIYAARELDPTLALDPTLEFKPMTADPQLEGLSIFKVAKPEALVVQDGTDSFCTQALTITKNGETRLVKPNTNLLLNAQHAKLSGSLDQGLVRVLKLDTDSGCSYLRMEYLGGSNLRHPPQSGRVREEISILTDLALQLSEIKNLQRFQYHGDLKPENIMVTVDGAKAIDPGYFGSLACEQGETLEIAVTTPCYYPFLKPDDLLAFGIIFWEAVLKRHPLLTRDEGSTDVIDGSVREWIESQQPATRNLLSPLLHLQRPSHLQPGIEPNLEAVLLKGLRLELNSANKISVGPGFESFAQWFKVLSPLSTKAGIV